MNKLGNLVLAACCLLAGCMGGEELATPAYSFLTFVDQGGKIYYQVRLDNLQQCKTMQDSREWLTRVYCTHQSAALPWEAELHFPQTNATQIHAASSEADCKRLISRATETKDQRVDVRRACQKAR